MPRGRLGRALTAPPEVLNRPLDYGESELEVSQRSNAPEEDESSESDLQYDGWEGFDDDLTPLPPITPLEPPSADNPLYGDREEVLRTLNIYAMARGYAITIQRTKPGRDKIQLWCTSTARPSLKKTDCPFRLVLKKDEVEAIENDATNYDSGEEMTVEDQEEPDKTLETSKTQWKLEIVDAGHNYDPSNDPATFAIIRNLFKDDGFKDLVKSNFRDNIHARQTMNTQQNTAPESMIRMRDIYNERSKVRRSVVFDNSIIDNRRYRPVDNDSRSKRYRLIENHAASN